MRTLEQAEQAGVERAAGWGAASLADLRALSTAELLGTRDAASFAKRPGLAIDGWALPDNPARMMADGRRHPATLLVGATADEGTSLSGGTTLDAATFRQQAEQRYHERAAEFLRLYPLEANADASHAQIDAMSNNMFAGHAPGPKLRTRTARSRPFCTTSTVSCRVATARSSARFIPASYTMCSTRYIPPSDHGRMQISAWPTP